MITYQTNRPLPEQYIDDILKAKSTAEEQCPSRYGEELSYFTTYNEVGRVPTLEHVYTFYDELIKDVMIHLAINEHCEWFHQPWFQVYTKNNPNTELPHHHFHPATALCYVHFIEPTSQKCAYQMLGGRKKIYPDQNPGDIIFFPPWALHGVDKLQCDEIRIVAAGNIQLSKVVLEGKDVTGYDGQTITFESEPVENNVQRAIFTIDSNTIDTIDNS